MSAVKVERWVVQARRSSDNQSWALDLECGHTVDYPRMGPVPTDHRCAECEKLADRLLANHADYHSMYERTCEVLQDYIDVMRAIAGWDGAAQTNGPVEAARECLARNY